MLRRGGGEPRVSTATPNENPSGESTAPDGGVSTATADGVSTATNDGVSTAKADGGDSAAGGPANAAAELAPGEEWSLAGDLGRRYASVSGDRNPIHMHPLAARPLGFQRAIAHGMWTKARCLAALEDRLPDAFSVEVRFRKPILLPARVELASAARGEEVDFAVRDAKRHTTHLEGRMRPLDDGRNPE
jgi:acyl dehydratase